MSQMRVVFVLLSARFLFAAARQEKTGGHDGRALHKVQMTQPEIRQKDPGHDPEMLQICHRNDQKPKNAELIKNVALAKKNAELAKLQDCNGNGIT